MKTLMLCFVLAGLMLASAKTYRISLMDTALLGNTELRAGEYQVEVVDKNAVIRRGKLKVEAPVQVETAESKYNATAVRFRVAEGKNHIQEIHVGGTKTRLIFAE